MHSENHYLQVPPMQFPPMQVPPMLLCPMQVPLTIFVFLIAIHLYLNFLCSKSAIGNIKFIYIICRATSSHLFNIKLL